MKKLLLALLVAAPAMATTIAGDFKESSMNREQALVLAKVVVAYGYRCDTVNAANRSPWTAGKFSLNCNDWRYSYTIEDKGGRVVVAVD